MQPWPSVAEEGLAGAESERGSLRSALMPTTTTVALSQLVHQREGWTVLRSCSDAPGCASPPAGSPVSAGVCRRHPKAAGCAKGSASRGERLGALQTRRVSLRDDLFLDSVPRGAAEPVVRSYDACDAESSANAQLAQARNASHAARAALKSAPLPIVAVVFFGTHLERLPLLRAAYEPYFQTTVYMSPKEDIGRALRASDGAASSSSSSSPRRAHAHHCRHGLKATYACVAEVARVHAAEGSNAAGVLYLHLSLIHI